MARRAKKFRRKVIAFLLDRDGTGCFFCGKNLLFRGEQECLGRLTVEHLEPISCGGVNDINNYVLAHAKCNLKAGILSAQDKRLLAAHIRKNDQAEIEKLYSKNKMLHQDRFSTIGENIKKEKLGKNRMHIHEQIKTLRKI